ncbi:hypothetical protein Q3G72_001578 [Acer saccharum]|nr:hypothetical protein Q3G72_001578 [Acer saccharum]
MLAKGRALRQLTWVQGSLVVGIPQCKIPHQRKEFSPPPKILEVEPTATTIRGLFSFSSLPPQQRKVDCAKDVFLSALSSGETPSLSLGLPRIAVAGAKPAYFAPRMREEKVVGGKNTVSLCEFRPCWSREAKDGSRYLACKKADRPKAQRWSAQS